MGTIDFCQPASLLGHAELLPRQVLLQLLPLLPAKMLGEAHPAAPPLNHCNHIARSEVDGCLRRAFDDSLVLPLMKL